MDNKVRELATVYLPLHQWTETEEYGPRVNRVYYFEALKRLREKVRQKLPEILPKKFMDLAS
jgi:hypothetical protein